MRHWLRIGLRAVFFAAMAASSVSVCRAQAPCAALDQAFPLPNRDGGPGGDNSFRPLPQFSPIRAAQGVPGTLSLSIAMDHVSAAAAGKPGALWVGNYKVTNLPAFRLAAGANTALQVIRPEDGAVLPISEACLSSHDWGFAGSTWALVQGDTLDVMLQSRLDYTGATDLTLPTNGAIPCRATNLHTHGLLVSPYHPAREGRGPYGDYVLDATEPRGSSQTPGTDDCGTQLGGPSGAASSPHAHGLTALPLHYLTTIPGQPGQSGIASGEHPSGLFWYHPHAHGFSVSQVGGATSGAITIGALTDYACPTGDGTPGHCAISNATTRVMVLKETQIVSTGTGWTTFTAPESTLCSPVGGTRRGECQGLEGSAGPTKWVFTVNGVQYPVVRVPAGRMEIWRLVNASAGMTFNLSLISDGPGHAALPFQVLAKDGVSIAQPQGHIIRRTEWLMMPSSRVEIAIPAPAAGGNYTLYNSVAQTGGNGSGDIWPQIDLARFVWGKQTTEAAASVAPAVNAPSGVMSVTGPATPMPRVAQVVDGPAGPCTFLPGDTRLIYFLHRFVRVPQPAGKPAINEVFGLVAGVKHADGTEDFYSQAQKGTVLHSIRQVWEAGTQPGGDAAFPGFMHNDWGTVCTVKGNVEPWELINFTGEDHNFHIHQSRFAMDPNGEFQFPRPGIPAAAYLRRTDAEVRDFSDPASPLLNDNIPVPRGQSFCAEDPQAPGCRGKTTAECTGAPNETVCPRPGKVSILMDFTRAEQVGEFVYHCHILEHEDGGMMAMIRVLCPRGDGSCATQQASQAICRAPE